MEAFVSKIVVEHNPFIDGLPMKISITNDLRQISNLKPIKAHVYHIFPVVVLLG